jgi:hypothetical protein
MGTRRKYPRYEYKNDALFVINGNSYKVDIKNISIDGVGFVFKHDIKMQTRDIGKLCMLDRTTNTLLIIVLDVRSINATYCGCKFVNRSGELFTILSEVQKNAIIPESIDTKKKEGWEGLAQYVEKNIQQNGNVGKYLEQPKRKGVYCGLY